MCIAEDGGTVTRRLICVSSSWWGRALGGGGAQCLLQPVTSGRSGLPISAESPAELPLTYSPDCKAIMVPSPQPPEPPEQTPGNSAEVPGSPARPPGKPPSPLWGMCSVSSFLFVPFSDVVTLVHPVELLDRTQLL